MDLKALENRINELRSVFLLVRLVDLDTFHEVRLEDGVLTEDSEGGETRHCFSTWGKEGRCEDCISARAGECKKSFSKFEFSDQNIFYAISQYVEIEGKSYALEMVSEVTDTTTIDAFGHKTFIETVNNYNEKLYRDSLTGAYNRRYLDDHVDHLPANTGVAIIDVDNFKQVNDTYGHGVGDEFLRATVKAAKENIRENDLVIRYGGDEFIVIVYNIPRENFADRLEHIRNAIKELHVDSAPGHRFSVSIGASHHVEPSLLDLDIADAQLYMSKQTKDTVSLH